jgi:hypothetical protein
MLKLKKTTNKNGFPSRLKDILLNFKKKRNHLTESYSNSLLGSMNIKQGYYYGLKINNTSLTVSMEKKAI